MTKNTLRTIALSLALATGGAGLLHTAQAQSPSTDGTAGATSSGTATPPAGKPGWDHHMGRPGPRGPRGPMGESPLMMLEHLKSKLNLTDAQQKLWAAAEAKGHELRTAMRAQHEKDEAALSSQIANAPLDLHALIAREEAGRAALKPQFDGVRDAWVAVYDSFDAQQKQIVTDAVKHRVERSKRFEQRMHDRHPGRGGQDRPAN